MTNPQQPADAIQQAGQANPLAARITDAVEDLYGMNHITREEVLETIEEELGDIESQLARAMKVVEAAKAWRNAPSDDYAEEHGLIDALDKFDAEAGKE